MNTLSRLTHYLRDSLLLSYDAWFRPDHLQQQLNAWVPPERGGENTIWWETLLRPISRQAWRVWLLCLPWWMMGSGGLALLYGKMLAWWQTLLLVLVLLLAGWGGTVLTPALGLTATSVLALGWYTQLRERELWIQLDIAFQPLLIPQNALWLGSIALIVGVMSGSLHILLSRKRWRVARVVTLTAGVILVILSGWWVSTITGIVSTIVTGSLIGLWITIVVFDYTDEKTPSDDVVVVALVVALGVALIVAGVVAVVVMGSVAGVVAVVVAVIVALIVAGNMAGGVVGNMANGVVAVVMFSVVFIVTFGITFGMTVIVAVVAAGLAWLPPALAWTALGLVAVAVGQHPRWEGAILTVGALTALRVEKAEGLDGNVMFLVALLAYYRLPWQLAPWIAGQWAYRRATRNPLVVLGQTLTMPPVRAMALLCGLPPFSDETARWRVPHLDQMLALAAREDRAVALKKVAEVAQSHYQDWAAPLAYTRIAADVLAHYEAVAHIAQVSQDITWFPEDLSSLALGVSQIWPCLLAISWDIERGLAARHGYARQQSFQKALKDLASLQQQLPSIGKQARLCWAPVVDTWLALIQRALDREQEVDTPLVNPYDAGNPLTAQRADLFRGRADLTARVAGALLDRNRPTLVLHGPRRMGKTSFLLQLPRLLPGRTVPVFVDLQRAAATDSAARFFYTVARAITNDARSHSRLILAKPRRDIFERDPFGAFSDWLDDVALPALETAGQFNVLLCFDEFEKLGQALEAGRVDVRVLDDLRHTIQHRQAISVLFAGVQTLEDLGPNWSSYFISVRPLRIGYLSEEEAVGLIRDPDPASGFNLQYADAAVADILAATRCHPYLVQLVCSTLVDLANRDRTLLATPELVQEALTLSLERGEPYFRNLWDETTGTDPATLSEGRRILRQAAAATGAIPVAEDSAEITRALDRLLRYDVLERVASGIQFQVPLVQRWVRERAPVD